jgi:hypothetical protein
VKKLILTFAALILVAAPALADMDITVADGPGGTNGGAFWVTVQEDPIGIYGNGVQFTTFCIESNEFLNFTDRYHVTLSNDAIYNAVPGGSDPLHAESAWLYTQWLDVLPHTAANADAVQKSIWAYEGEAGGDNTLQLYTDAGTAVSGGWTNPDIKVMNLWADGQANNWDARHQDLLVRVPAPAAIGLGVLGLALVGWLKRRVG